MPIITYIALGSNLNQPTQQLKTAISALQQLPNTEFISVSHFYQTKPIGITDQPDFINAVVCLKTQLPPLTLLSQLQTIETTQARIRKQKNGPRTLDLDILLYGNQIITETNLIIPHPHLTERAFVLVPLLEIASNLTLPNGESLQLYLTKLGNTDKFVQRI